MYSPNHSIYQLEDIIIVFQSKKQSYMGSYGRFGLGTQAARAHV